MDLRIWWPVFFILGMLVRQGVQTAGRARTGENISHIGALLSHIPHCSCSPNLPLILRTLISLRLTDSLRHPDLLRPGQGDEEEEEDQEVGEEEEGEAGAGQADPRGPKDPLRL